MEEVYVARGAVAEITRHLSVIREQIDLERCEGLEGDWTAIAEAFESIRTSADTAARAAWLVQYEGSVQ